MERNADMQILGKQIFNQGVKELDRLEREGYFDFARVGSPQVKRGMSRMLNLLKAMGETPA